MALDAQAAARKVDDLFRALDARRSAVNKRQRYFDGDQPLAYASKEFREFHKRRFDGWSDNWCSVVGSAAPELTEFASIRLGDDVQTMSDDEKVLLRDWNVNDGQAKSAQGFLSGAVTSTSYALVWGDRNDEPLLTWEHASQAYIERDPETGRTLFSVKAWRDEDMDYATLYTDDEVWKFERRASYVSPGGIQLPTWVGLPGGWKMRSGAEQNPMPNPLGVNPMVEFPNRPQLGKGPISDIEGTMAMQDGINLMWAYLFGAADYASMPARVVMGQDPPMMPVLDENGQKVGEKPVAMKDLQQWRMLWLSGESAKIGQWDAAKLDVFTNVINIMVKHIASQTKTPVNYITGEMNNVNGEALGALRVPLVMKVRDGHKHLAGPMRDVFRRFALVRGNAKAAEACRVGVIGWRNPETATDAQVSDAALKDSQIGWSAAGILERRYGLNQTEIDQEIRRREDEATDPVLAGVLRGQGGTGAVPPVGG